MVVLDADTQFQFQTEVEFTLPLGFVDDAGRIHRSGVMRLATALDEVAPLQDPRVQSNQAYVSILLLSRVLTRLGTMAPVPPAVVERLFSTDFGYLQDLFIRLNNAGSSLAETACPDCGSHFAVDLAAG
jgi:hypothetical protein